MNLELFQDITFDDREAFDDFKLALQLNHDKIAQVMYAANKTYATYPLVDAAEHSKDWQQNLQQELGSIFTLNGLTGLPDFSGADLSQPEDFADFMQSLVFVEAQINAALGITS